MPPCLIFEDDHLLVVNKPAGINTHSPSPYAGEGIYEWLRGREARWAMLAIVHRLDKETSGLLVFTKTPIGNRSLTRQFTEREVHKHYALATARFSRQMPVTAKTSLFRAGERYVSRPLRPGAEVAETWFGELSPETRKLVAGVENEAGVRLLQAEPRTGRTHQIRVHAAELGFPILGDTLYGGSPAGRVCLHAARLGFAHPETGKEIWFEAPVDFFADPGAELRRALIPASETNACRLLHGASEGMKGVYVDALGDFALFQSEQAPSRDQVARVIGCFPAAGIYHKPLSRQVRRLAASEAGPKLVEGNTAPDPFFIRENGISYELSFSQGYSVGLFLDQRDNRRRLLQRYAGPNLPLGPGAGEASFSVLNTFAYTCGFSVCAARAGARATSLDLSRKYLEWGKRNFRLNGLNPDDHDFIYGDVFEWLRRLGRKSRLFDVILLDPPTFSQSKDSGVFRVERDYGKLVTAALPLLRPRGVLFCSSNASEWVPENFVEQITAAITKSGRQILKQQYCPQPPDFRISRLEPAYLKTVWLCVE